MPTAAPGHGRQGVTASNAALTSPADSAQSAHVYLVEEWRRSELEVADSVHHAILESIVVLYDSAERSSVSAAARDRQLHVVDVMNQQNQWSWEAFRTTINQRADSALGREELP
jgi:hypothetical protein